MFLPVPSFPSCSPAITDPDLLHQICTWQRMGKHTENNKGWGRMKRANSNFYWGQGLEIKPQAKHKAASLFILQLVEFFFFNVKWQEPNFRKSQLSQDLKERKPWSRTFSWNACRLELMIFPWLDLQAKMQSSLGAPGSSHSCKRGKYRSPNYIFNLPICSLLPTSSTAWTLRFKWLLHILWGTVI